MLPEKPNAKGLRSFETCVLIDNSLCRKLFSSLESVTTFDEIFKVTLVPNFLFLLLIYEYVN